MNPVCTRSDNNIEISHNIESDSMSAPDGRKQSSVGG